MSTLTERAIGGDAQAQYELGRQHAARQEWPRARRHFRSAADAGHAGAMTELALFALFGIGMPPDYARALEQLATAEKLGSGEASYQLALLGWCGILVPRDLAEMGRRLRDAAERDFPAALRAAAMIYRRQSDDPGMQALADACLARATSLGDPISTYLYALVRRAAAADDADAMMRLAAARSVRRAGDGAAAVDAAVAEAPRPKLAPIELAPRLLGTPQRHSDEPLVETIDEVYAAEECEYMIALGEPYLLRSMTIHDERAELVASEVRRSSDHSFYTFQEDFALCWLQERMLAHLGLPLVQAEPLVLLRYLPSEEYKPHRDYLPPSAPGNTRRPEDPGQRVHTVFSYLADVEDGGETEFPLLGVRVAPKRGRVVHFINLLANGEPDARTLHAGLPVRAGTKWLATLWTRERRYREY
ncbi:MAG TPA: 2OG-Fe(II) oxygenase [Candidatus Saccharimonadia bacterium]|nr:2OG-Fe(II) oxygenase [Candidatus Saccharimonadia bacterium]